MVNSHSHHRAGGPRRTCTPRRKRERTFCHVQHRPGGFTDRLSRRPPGSLTRQCRSLQAAEEGRGSGRRVTRLVSQRRKKALRPERGGQLRWASPRLDWTSVTPKLIRHTQEGPAAQGRNPHNSRRKSLAGAPQEVPARGSPEHGECTFGRVFRPLPHLTVVDSFLS